ncbi:DUF3023 domain-containing protein [Ehrlichia ruminantium]|uniref:DUF3023 domain-containing protein n=1 Tax=Ehrlichia ruminantium TaxID=779 RepID=UPI00130EE956|nr:DUF3023 domain-containing protein [Ehrlichia ruminantium]QGR02483.1 DUF3023 domain-containing protein [Ehrlichia ruminantium]
MPFNSENPFADKREVSDLLCSAINLVPEQVKILDIDCVGYTDQGQLTIFLCSKNLLPAPKNTSLFRISATIPVDIIVNSDSKQLSDAFIFEESEKKDGYVICKIYCMVNEENFFRFTKPWGVDIPAIPYQDVIKHSTIKYIHLTTKDTSHPIEYYLVDVAGLNAIFKRNSDLHKEKMQQLMAINNGLCNEICTQSSGRQVSFIRCIGNTGNDGVLRVQLQCPIDLLPIPKNNSLFIIRMKISSHAILASELLASAARLTESEKLSPYIKCDIYCIVEKRALGKFVDECHDAQEKPYFEDIIQHCSVKCVKLHTQEMHTLQITEEEIINSIGSCNAEFEYFTNDPRRLIDKLEEFEVTANNTLCKILPTLCALYKKDMVVKKARCIGNTIDPSKGLVIYPASIYPKNLLPHPQGTSLFLIRSRLLTNVVLNTPELCRVHYLDEKETLSKYLLCDIYCLVYEKDIITFKNLCEKTKHIPLVDIIHICDIKCVRVHTKGSSKFPFDEARMLQHFGKIVGNILTGEELQSPTDSGSHSSTVSESSPAISQDDDSSPCSSTSKKHRPIKSRLLQIRKQFRESSSSASVSSEDDLSTKEEVTQKRHQLLLKLEELKKEREQEEKEEIEKITKKQNEDGEGEGGAEIEKIIKEQEQDEEEGGEGIAALTTILSDQQISQSSSEEELCIL